MKRRCLDQSHLIERINSFYSDGSSFDSKKKSVAVFLFRRDIRLTDNTSLKILSDISFSIANKTKIGAIPILPVFFFNPIQCEPSLNSYFGLPSFVFLCESLIALDNSLENEELGWPCPTEFIPSSESLFSLPKEMLLSKSSIPPLKHLCCLYGPDEDCLKVIQRYFNVVMLGFNEDFTPFAIKRDSSLRTFCQKNNISVISSGISIDDDPEYTLFSFGFIQTNLKKNYSVFTPFYRAAVNYATTKPPNLSSKSPLRSSFLLNGPQYFPSECIYEPVKAFSIALQQLNVSCKICLGFSEHGGRLAGIRRMSYIKDLQKYAETRNEIDNENGTTMLSPHLKFGTVSVREVFHTIKTLYGLQSDLIRELLWREFYAILVFSHPNLVQAQIAPNVLNSPFREQYQDFQWKWEEKHWEAFKNGCTGVPLVDAAIRCLQQTGWCHNRCRMILGNFAIKTLGVDWRIGEKWFANNAVDYDVASNNGGWLWCSGQGADAQPYYRTFNPFLQSKRYDPDAKFIKRWIPELRSFSSTHIHTWGERKLNIGGNPETEQGLLFHNQMSSRKASSSYPTRPIVDIQKANRIVKELFSSFHA